MENIRLDMHAHLAPILPEKLATLPDVSWSAETETLTLDGRAIGMKNLFRPHALLAWMDANSIAQAWISIPPPLYRQKLPADKAKAWTQYVNEGLRAVAAQHPQRLSAMLHLPLEHPELAIAAAKAAVAEGQKLFAVPSGDGKKVMLSDPIYEPLWQTLGEAGSFLLFHPVECHDSRLKPFYLENLLGNPYETALAAAHLAFSGVTKRHPGLTLCFSHGGGATAMVASRMAKAQRIGRPGIDPATTPSPREAFKQFYADCILHDPAALDFAAKNFGDAHIVFGSDWPFPLGLPEPHAELSGMTQSLRQKAFDENPKRLLEKFGGTK